MLVIICSDSVINFPFKSKITAFTLVVPKSRPQTNSLPILTSSFIKKLKLHQAFIEKALEPRTPKPFSLIISSYFHIRHPHAEAHLLQILMLCLMQGKWLHLVIPPAHQTDSSEYVS